MLTSSFTFFLSTLSIFAWTSYSIYSSICSSVYLSLLFRKLLGFFFSYLPCLLIEGRFVFLVEFDRPFGYFFSFSSSFLSYFLGSSFFFAFTPELFGKGGGGSGFFSGPLLLFCAGF